jgi:hypothetical protein
MYSPRTAKLHAARTPWSRHWWHSPWSSCSIPNPGIERPDPRHHVDASATRCVRFAGGDVPPSVSRAPAWQYPFVPTSEFELNQPRAHRSPAIVEWKLNRLNEPHVAPLNGWVRELRVACGGGESVPWFDPAGGGIHSPIVMLLEAPGPRSVGSGSPRPAEKGSGIISVDNNDATAATCHRYLREAEIPRDRVVSWNIVPWYVGDGSRIRAVNSADLAKARPYLDQFLALLEWPRIVLLCGRKAQEGWARAQPRFSGVVIDAPHPSVRGLNAPGARDRLTEALAEARRIARR